MLTILFNWIYVAITVFCLGAGFATLVEKRLGYRIKRTDSLWMTGIVIATVYAQYFSLITKVGLLANLILIGVCLVIVVLCRHSIVSYLRDAWQGTSTVKKLMIGLLFVVWAYFTSRGYMHYDSDLYHGQSIRWIEEYGVVPGLGNLHERFAYNSASFALSALYSMKFLLGYSMHAMSGFFALLLSITALDIGKSWKRKKFLLADYARIGAIYYLTTIIEQVVAPASDYSIMCMVFFIVIKWLDMLEEREQSIVPYALLCVAGVYALTLKLTAGLILLLLIKPAYMLIKEKRIKEILLYLSMGLLVAIPWFARTVVISGWLLYPFSALDLFDVDWKISTWKVDYDSAHISMYGKGIYDWTQMNAPVWEWIPNWFRTTLFTMEKLLILGAVLCMVLFAGLSIWVLAKKKWQELDTMLVLGTMFCSYLFWQLSAPLMRYGYAYVLLLDFLIIGWILMKTGWNKLEKLAYGVIVVYGVYKLFTVGEYISTTYLQGYYIWQQDYGTYEMNAYPVGDEIIYSTVSGDRTGYEYFPAIPNVPMVELRGEGFDEGFRSTTP